ncbi:TPA: replication endonuclease, partial [Escherichia coli]|nr:replication endonuclease [Escherichia coli]
MDVKASGRFVPPSAFAAGTGKTFTGAYAWNAPREAVGRERPLTRDEMRQVQGVLSTINRLPYFLRSLFTSRYDYIRRNKSPVHGFYFLTSTFQRRLWPRIERVNQRHEMNTDASLLFLAERDHYARLPGMNDKELKKFAARISSQLFMMYEELCDAWVDAHGEKESLFTDEAQAHLYGHVAGAARAFNISPLYWKKYRKGQMTTRQAYSAIARLFNDEWWTHQLKGQRMRWHEALL